MCKQEEITNAFYLYPVMLNLINTTCNTAKTVCRGYANEFHKNSSFWKSYNNTVVVTYSVQGVLPQ